MNKASGYREVHASTGDGHRLFARDYGPAESPLVPVLCLPGLTRNSKDFETIAPRLATGRRVICPDFRGRGMSQYSPEPSTYRPDIELEDTLRLLDQLGIARVAVIGTSRGGLVAMVMAAKAKVRMAGVVLNDVGPHLEIAGLLRIRSYLGIEPQFPSWEMAVAAMQAANPGFVGMSDAEWMAFARRVFRDQDGKPRIDYDPKIAVSFPSEEDLAAGKLPDAWPLFELVAPLPALLLRGENSDLLSEATAAEMQHRYPALMAVTVKNRAHVPFLDEPECVAAIDSWLGLVDAA